MQTHDTASPPADVLVTGHFNKQDDYAVYRSHGSKSWLITYTLQGQGCYQQYRSQFQAIPGDIILLQPDIPHQYMVPSGGSWEFFWVHFQPRADWSPWWHFPAIGQGLFKIHITTPGIRERLHQTFLRLHNDLNTSAYIRNSSRDSLMREATNTLFQRELVLNGLEEILLLALREQKNRESTIVDGRIQQILDCVMLDPGAHYDVATLARRVSLSPSRLSHLFKQETGDSVTNTILTLRLNKAARLLEFSTLSVGTIAQEIGFSSSFYFSRQFQRHFGVSPRAYRQQHLPGNDGGN